MVISDKKNKVLITLLIFLILFIGIIWWGGSKADGNAKKNMEQLIEKGYKFGDSDAPITIVEFSNFQCPSCKDSHNTIKEILVEEIKSGKIYYVYKHLKLRQFKLSSIINKRVAAITNDKKRLKVISEIFKDQGVWSEMDKSQLNHYMKEIELTDSLENGNLQKSILKEAKNFSVVSTPTMFINGKKIQGSLTKRSFKKIINGILTD